MAKAPRLGPYICGIDAALDVVSGKWKGLILWELETHGVRRFAEVPPRVEYSLTEHGRTLNRALGPLGARDAERMRRDLQPH
ncbi:winged helix-turn-helix transcriptional regulator [Streptomyces sp. NPDC102365]|uniref:winged helix-turn-helix transcriptional regulator n=1 Tax=Streptomyces sp. NPDC102365 TaxID=3366162 RepID=UPI00380A2BD7